MATKKDPTVTGTPTGDPYPEGTHPARAVPEVTTSAERLEYRDNPDKPDPTAIAQVEIPRDDV